MAGTAESPSFPGRRAAWLLFVLALGAALASVAIPIYLIRPFEVQTPRGVAVSYALRAAAPWVTAACLLAGVALAVRLGRGARWWKRLGLAVLLLPLLGAAWLARFNLFEKMFAPLAGPAFVPVAVASFVAPADMVLAVEAGGAAAAFPIRQLAYHHVANVKVGEKAVVATY
jgi:hypothetical protein